MKDEDVLFKGPPPMQYLPHRYPFLMCDKILLHELDFVRGRKCVSYNEPFFQGHFPQEPIMPGVLIIEALAQLASFLFNKPSGRPEDYLQSGMSYLVRADNFTFRRKVVPGDILVLEAKLIQLRKKRYLRSQVTALVEEDECVRGEVALAFSSEDRVIPS